MIEYAEEYVLSFFLKSIENADVLTGDYLIESNYFNGAETSALAEISYCYYFKYHRIIPEDVLKHTIQQNEKLDETIKISLEKKFSELLDFSGVSEDNVGYWIDELRKENLARKFQSSIISSLGEIEKDQKHEGILKAYHSLTNSLAGMSDIIHPSTERTIAINDEGWIRKRIELYNEISKNPDAYAGVKTGLSDLDMLTNGIRPGEMWVLVSRTNVGKSTFLNNIAHNAFRYGGKNVLFASLEMDIDATSIRFDSLYTGLPSKSIQNGWLSNEEREVYEEQLIGLTYEANKLFFVPQVKAQTVQQIERELLVVQKKHNLSIDLVVIDYLNILRTTNPEANRLSRPDYITLVAQEVRDIAWRHKTATLTAAQLNRIGADSKSDVGTEAISGSDYIGNTADLIMRLVQTPDDAQRNVIQGKIIKSRRTQKANLEFMADLDRSYVGDITWVQNYT